MVIMSGRQAPGKAWCVGHFLAALAVVDQQ